MPRSGAVRRLSGGPQVGGPPWDDGRGIAAAQERRVHRGATTCVGARSGRDERWPAPGRAGARRRRRAVDHRRRRHRARLRGLRRRHRPERAGRRWPGSRTSGPTSSSSTSCSRTSTASRSRSGSAATASTSRSSSSPPGTTPADKVEGLTVGGDDYVTKPFTLAEVIARVHAILRRTVGLGRRRRRPAAVRRPRDERRHPRGLARR